MIYETTSIENFLQMSVALGLNVSVETWNNAEDETIVDVAQRLIATNDRDVVIGDFLINVIDDFGERIHHGELDVEKLFPCSRFNTSDYMLTGSTYIPIIVK